MKMDNKSLSMETMKSSKDMLKMLSNGKKKQVNFPTTEVQLTCQSCSISTFANVHQLDQHLYREHKEVKYCCQDCKRSFASFANLNRHRLMHRGGNDEMKMRKYACYLCNRHFNFKSNFDRHFTIHYKPHTCLRCSRSFGFLKQLRRHLWMSHALYFNQISHNTFRKDYTTTPSTSSNYDYDDEDIIEKCDHEQDANDSESLKSFTNDDGGKDSLK